MKKRIYFRADANIEIGYGHFIRTLALADMLKDNFECVFFTTDPTDFQIKELEKVCRYIALKDNAGKFQSFLDCLDGDEIVFLDNYFFTSEYEMKIKEKGCKLVVLARPDKHHFADIVLNFVETDFSGFSVEPYTKIILGLQWTILREPFRNSLDYKSIRSNRIILSFGGTDQFSLTEKFIELLKGRDLAIICTSKIAEERRISFEQSGCIVYTDITPDVIADIFHHSNCAILSSSSICLEALACGCKVFAGYYVENQQSFYNILLERNFIVGLGDLMRFEDISFMSELDSYISTDDTSNIPIDFSRQKEQYIELFEELCL